LLFTRKEYDGYSKSAVDEIMRTGKFVAADVIVPATDPGYWSTHALTFGELYEVPDSEVFGLPETIEKRFGCSHDFILEQIEVHDEDAEHFDVISVFVGNRVLVNSLGEANRIPATRFAASAEKKVVFNKLVSHGLQVTVGFINKTTEPRRLRAKVRGRLKLSYLDAPKF
jgi:hypothetical protein